MRSRGRIARLTVVVIALVTLAAACGSSDNSSDTTTTTKGSTTTTAGSSGAVKPADNGGRKDGADQLVIGSVLPQTGKLASIGPPMIKGVEMAVRDVNAAGGVNGQDIKLIEKDDGGGAANDIAKTSVDELINNDQVAAIVGAAASGTTKEVEDKITSSGTVECSPSNTGSDLTTRPDKGLYFRTAPPDNLQAQALAKAVTDDGKQNVAIVAQNSDYGTGFVKFLAPALKDNGAKVVADVTYDPNGTSFDAEIQKVVSAKPDAVVLIGYPEDGGLILKNMIQKGVGPDKVQIYVTDGMQDNELYKQVDPNDPSVTQGIKGTAPSAAPTNGASFFPDAFKQFAPDVASPIYSAQAYDCVIAIALAAQKAGSNAPYDIALNLNDITGGVPGATACDTYESCKKALDAGDDIDYNGASGALDFTAYGEPSAGEYEVYTFQADGTYETTTRVTIGS